MFSPIFEIATMTLASGRVAFSLTNDEIFRPIRETIWKHSAPEQGTIRLGDQDYPARMVHRFAFAVVDAESNETGDVGHHHEFDAAKEPRPIGWIGELFSCVMCMSAWTSFVIFAAWLLFGEASVWSCAPFALWASANAYAKWLHS